MTVKCLCCLKRDAGHCYACTHCVDDMRRWLAEIEDYSSVMIGMSRGIRGRGLGVTGGAFGSRPPMNLTIAAVLDIRSTSADHVRENSPAFDPVGIDEHDHVRSLPASLNGIASWIREEMGATEPTEWTLVSEAHYLRSQVSACAHAQWVDELHSDLRELHAQARALAHDSPPKPLGHCLTVECDGLVFWSTGAGSDTQRARCSDCARTYDGLDLVRLGAAEEAAG